MYIYIYIILLFNAYIYIYIFVWIICIYCMYIYIYIYTWLCFVTWSGHSNQVSPGILYRSCLQKNPQNLGSYQYLSINDLECLKEFWWPLDTVCSKTQHLRELRRFSGYWPQTGCLCLFTHIPNSHKQDRTFQVERWSLFQWISFLGSSWLLSILPSTASGIKI